MLMDNYTLSWLMRQSFIASRCVNNGKSFRVLVIKAKYWMSNSIWLNHPKMKLYGSHTDCCL